MTPEQIRTVKINMKKAGLNDAAYRLLLWNVAQVASCKDLDQAGFENVMATLEDIHGDGNYWRGVVADRKRFASSRQLHLINELFAKYEIAARAADVAEIDQYKLPGLVQRHTHNATRDAARMAPWQAHNLIEALKKILARDESFAKAVADLAV